MTTFGFIGTGHLGSMLVKKFVETGAIEAEEILASNRTPEKVERLAEATGIRSVSNRVVAELSDVIFICVRPLEVRDVLSERRLPAQFPEASHLSGRGCVAGKYCRASARPAWLAPFPAWPLRSCRA